MYRGEYIYIRGEERMLVRVYRREECVCRPRGFRIIRGADGSEGYFLPGSF